MTISSVFRNTYVALRIWKTTNAYNKYYYYAKSYTRAFGQAQKFSGKKKKLQASFWEIKSCLFIQSCIQGMIGRKRAATVRKYEMLHLIHGTSVNNIQRVWRGYLGRRCFFSKLKLKSTCLLQRVAMGFIGRTKEKLERQRLETTRKLNNVALKVNSFSRRNFLFIALFLFHIGRRFLSYYERFNVGGK